MLATMGQVTTLYVTPKLLRSWADLCERQWEKTLPGDSVIFYRISLLNNNVLELAFDQEEMHRIEKEKGDKEKYRV